MKARQSSVSITYDGKSTSVLNLNKTAFTFTDPASGEADSLDITFFERSASAVSGGKVEVNKPLSATIALTNWATQGDNRTLDCGDFLVDSVSYSGWPWTGTVKAVSVPANTGFRQTKRTKVWEKATVQKIGQEIASNAGIELLWDVEGDDPQITTLEQSETTDCEFYMNLCKTYGLSMKVYSNKIVVYSRTEYKKKDAVCTIYPHQILSWSWSQNLAGTYTGGEYTYTQPKTNKEIKVTLGTADRLLKMTGKADDEADAQKKLQAGIDEANHGATKLSLTVKGKLLVSGQNVEVSLGALSGKYFTDTTTHNLGSSGYTTDLELSLIE